jgi:hypothetical protein
MRIFCAMAQEIAGFPLAYSTWISQGGGLTNGRYNAGPVRGKTRDQGLAMFYDVWRNSAPEWKDEYTRRATVGMMSPSEQEEYNRKQAYIKSIRAPRPPAAPATAPATAPAPAPAPAQSSQSGQLSGASSTIAPSKAAPTSGSIVGMDGKPIPMTPGNAPTGVPALPQPPQGSPIPVLPITSPKPAPNQAAGIDRPVAMNPMPAPAPAPEAVQAGQMPSRSQLLKDQTKAGMPIGAPRAIPVEQPKPQPAAQPTVPQNEDRLSNEDLSGQGYTLVGSKSGMKKWRRGAEMNKQNAEAAAMTRSNMVSSPIFGKSTAGAPTAPSKEMFRTKLGMSADGTQATIVPVSGTPTADFVKYEGASKRIHTPDEQPGDMQTVNNYVGRDTAGWTPEQRQDIAKDEKAGLYQAGRYVGKDPKKLQMQQEQDKRTYRR